MDLSSLMNAIKKTEPEEIYNLAAMSFVKASWDEPIATGEITGLGSTRVFEAARIVNPKIKVYQAASSEMFGKAEEVPQNERTRFHPRSPYGISKVYAYHSAVNYRESYDMFVSCGILFNHESPRRGLEFVTRKISEGVARIKFGGDKKILLGNMDAKRDWGYAGDFVEAMWLMLQQDKADDFVVGTGETHSVREFVETAFDYAGIKNWQNYIKQDEKYMRPAEVDILLADYSKAKRVLGWEPKVKFNKLVEMMVQADIDRLAK